MPWLTCVETKNNLATQGEYSNIAVLQDVTMFTLEMLHEVRRELVPSEVDAADIISGIVVAIDMIRTYCRHLKYIKNIYVLTNARYSKPLEETEGDIEAIRDEMSKNNIQFKVLGVDFDDTENGIVESEDDGPIDPRKKQSEAILKKLCEIPDSVFANAQEAVDSLQLPSVKKVRPIKTFAGKLTLGDLTEYPIDNCISIDIEAFPATRVATASTAVAYATAGKPAASQATQGSPDAKLSALKKQGLQEVKRLTEFYVVDENDPEVKTEVEAEDVKSGYRFGPDIVVLTEEEEQVIKLRSQEPASMMIVGFVKENMIPRYMSMSNTDYVVGAKGEPEATMALSSLIHALFLEKSAAIVRLVQKDGKDAQMCALTPVIEENLECLVLTHLPFAQDQRHYRFPPLGEVRVKDKETGGFKTVTEHPMIPTEEMQDAMDQLVDDMDLMQADDGFEYAPPDQVYNPLIHRIKQVIKHCALMDNTQDIPDILPILKKYSGPPAHVVENASKSIAKLESLLATKRVETKEERKERVKLERETKGTAGAEPKDELRVEEQPIDIETLLANSGPVDEAPRIKIESSQAPSSVPASSGTQDVLHLGTTTSDVSISDTSPISDFEAALERALGSPNKTLILSSACTQVATILADLLEIAQAPNPAVDDTITGLLGLLGKAVSASEQSAALGVAVKAKFEDLVENEEIGEHLVDVVTETLNKL